MLDLIEIEPPRRLTGGALVATVIVALFAGCGGSGNVMPAAQACTEQAEVWCALAPPARSYAFDCIAVYRSDCMPEFGAVDPSRQDTCLDAIATNPHRRCVPSACVMLWSQPGALHHFCSD